MNLLPGTQQIVGDGDIAIGTSGIPIRVFSIEAISGGTASAITEQYTPNIDLVLKVALMVEEN